MNKGTSRLKIHLIMAPTNFELNYGDMGKGIDPPLGILYIASYIRKKAPLDYDIFITDGILDGYEKTLKEVLKVKGDIIGISAVTLNILGAYRLIDAIKERMPEVKVILGGPHPTALPEEAFYRSHPDVVVIGEGEVTFKELVFAFQSGKASLDDLMDIDGICLLANDKPVRTKPRRFISNLDEIPFPARDLVDMRRYTGHPMKRGAGLSTGYLSSRGCPFRCTFCSNNVWRTSTPPYRKRSPENIADELEELKERGFDEVFDQSDEFNTNIKHSKKVLREIIDRNLKMNIKCQLRAKPIDDELVELMKQAGVWYVHLGIESGNEETLLGIRKKVTLKDVENCCELLQRHQIRVWGLFMYFNIWEDNGSLCYENYDMSMKTFEYAKSLYKRKLINFFGGSITTPVPGSKLWSIALRHNLIKEECIGNYDLWFYKRDLRLVSKLPGLPESDIFKLHQKTYKFTIRAFLRERVLTFHNIAYAVRRTVYYLKRGLLLSFKRLPFFMKNRA